MYRVKDVVDVCGCSDETVRNYVKKHMPSVMVENGKAMEFNETQFIELVRNLPKKNTVSEPSSNNLEVSSNNLEVEKLETVNRLIELHEMKLKMLNRPKVEAPRKIGQIPLLTENEEEFVTIRSYCNRKGMTGMSDGKMGTMGKRASDVCRVMDVTPNKVQEGKYIVNSYPIHILNKVFYQFY